MGILTPIAERIEQCGFFLEISAARLSKFFDSLDRQGHVAAVLFPAAGKDLLRLFWIFFHCPARSRYPGPDDEPLPQPGASGYPVKFKPPLGAGHIRIAHVPGENPGRITSDDV